MPLTEGTWHKDLSETQVAAVHAVLPHSLTIICSPPRNWQDIAQFAGWYDVVQPADDLRAKALLATAGPNVAANNFTEAAVRTHFKFALNSASMEGAVGLYVPRTSDEHSCHVHNSQC